MSQGTQGRTSRGATERLQDHSESCHQKFPSSAPFVSASPSPPPIFLFFFCKQTCSATYSIRCVRSSTQLPFAFSSPDQLAQAVTRISFSISREGTFWHTLLQQPRLLWVELCTPATPSTKKKYVKSLPSPYYLRM